MFLLTFFKEHFFLFEKVGRMTLTLYVIMPSNIIIMLLNTIFMPLHIIIMPLNSIIMPLKGTIICKFAAGVVDTGGKLPPVSLITAANLPPVSLTPVANLPPVSTTQGKLGLGGN